MECGAGNTLDRSSSEEPPNPFRQIERNAAALAASLMAIHGGRWSVDIDHDDCFVLVSRELPGWP